MLPWAWQEVEGETVSVNEVDYHCAASRAERRAARTWSGQVVWRMCCPAHAGNKVSCGVALMNVCAVWPCGCCVMGSSGQSTPD